MPQISDVHFAPIVIKLEQLEEENKCSGDPYDFDGDCSLTNNEQPSQPPIQPENSAVADFNECPVATSNDMKSESMAKENAENDSNKLKLPLNCDIQVENNNCVGGKSTTITYSCHRCKSIFASRNAFEFHYKQSYNEQPIYTCQICEKQMKNKRSYQRHYNRHASPKEFKCSVCLKTFAQEKIFKQHESVHNLTTARTCTECKQEFFDLLKYKSHCRTHHDQKKKQQKYQCEDCGKLMKNRSSLSMHMKIHNNDRQFGCMLCDQKFVQKINLVNHVKVHNAIKTHSCDECGKSFVGQSQLLRHHTYHTNIRTFECEVCKKFYKTKRDLKLHLMVHSVQRPHKCSTCDKTFLSTSKLKQHLNVHTGLRPYKCHYCPKDFTNFPNWLKHTRRRHKVDHKTGEKLVVMPNFLKKVKKSTATNNNGSTENVKAGRSREKKESKRKTAAKTGSDEVKLIATIKCEEPVNIIDVHDGELMPCSDLPLTESNMQQLPEATIMFAENQQPKCSTDLSTITVNNRTLPLNTSDDLERAASLLMHQTLELEDDPEYINIKSESLDPSLYQNQYSFYETDGTVAGGGKISRQCNDFNFVSVSDFQTNYHYSDPTETYSYYPQTTQCDFAMMPLPPINTVKSKLKYVDPSTLIFSTSAANVL